MLAAVQSVPRTRHVLRKLGHAALGVVRGRDQVARGRLAHRRSLESGGIVELDQRIQIPRLEADVHPAQRLRGIGFGIKLDELAVVHLDERLRRLAVAAHCEGFFKAQLFIKSTGLVEISYANGGMGDASQFR